ncbi:hypothetical protein V8C42DRAFT_336002 [Trichoderma barbatum]
MFLSAIFFAFLYSSDGLLLVTGMQSVSIQNGIGPFTPGNCLSTKFCIRASWHWGSAFASGFPSPSAQTWLMATNWRPSSCRTDTGTSRSCPS